MEAKTENKMTRITLLIVLIFSFFSVPAKDKQLTISKERVELIITETTTEAQLKKFQKTLKEEANIDFSFKDIIYNSKKQISKITIEVDSNDGIKSIGILMISNIHNVGFIRNYQYKSGSSSEEPLIIGNIGEKEIKLN